MADKDERGDCDESTSEPSALEILQADVMPVNHPIGKARAEIGTCNDPLVEAAASISSGDGDEEFPISKKRGRRRIVDDDSDPTFQIVDLCNSSSSSSSTSSSSSSSDDEGGQQDQKGKYQSSKSDVLNGGGTRQVLSVSASSTSVTTKRGDRNAPKTSKVINLAESESDDSDTSSDSGFIPFASSKRHPEYGKKGTAAASKEKAPVSKRARPGPTLPFFTRHRGAQSLAIKNKQVNGKEETSSRLWPSPSRFYRAVLRWVYTPEKWLIEKDAQSTKKMMSLPSLSTKFESLLEYQKVMSQLVLTETLASLEQDLVGEVAPKLTCVQGKICDACELETTEGLGLGTAGEDVKLFSVRIKLQLPRVTNSSGKELTPRCPFSGGDLLGLRFDQQGPSEKGLGLGVVQSGDAVYDTIGKRVRSPTIIYLLVCASSMGGDGAGGPGGWLSLSAIQDCIGHGKYGDDDGVRVSLVSGGGSVMTASREYQAVMSVSSMPDRLRRNLLDPSLTGGRQLIRRSSSTSRCMERGGEYDSPPTNIPGKMWKGLQEAFNPSQLAAIREVARGSPSGLTLLQGPPGTGKTRTIMGIIGVLLTRGCPDLALSPSQVSHGSKAFSRGKGMRIKVGESVSSGGGNQKGAKIVAPEAAVDESGNTKRRILIVAPSNAAVDEMVTRLVMNGVPGSDGDAFFPNVVRVGGSRVGDPDDQRDTGREGTRQRMSSLVQAVSLEHLVEIRKSSYRENWPIRLDLLLKAQVVCATLSGSGSYALVQSLLLGINKSEKQERFINKKKGRGNTGSNRAARYPILTFDAVVMDEAAQAVEPSSLIPLKFNPRAIVLVGDPAQLPATIFSNTAKDANYGQSLFQRLQRGGHPKLMLDTQYRMHPSIASFPSARFYNGLLRSASTVTEASHGQVFHRIDRFGPYIFHNVREGRLRKGKEEVSAMSTTSLCNHAEAEYIILLLKDLVHSFPSFNFNGRVGVITPYRNQIKVLQKGMWKTGLRQDGVEVSTVDGFQGREKDIIIFSCVRAPEQGSEAIMRNGIGFMGDWRRLNVAITRAKYSMWIVGHAGTLRKDNEWRELINDSRRRGAFVDQSNESSPDDAVESSEALPYGQFGEGDLPGQNPSG